MDFRGKTGALSDLTQEVIKEEDDEDENTSDHGSFADRQRDDMNKAQVEEEDNSLLDSDARIQATTPPNEEN